NNKAGEVQNRVVVSQEKKTEKPADVIHSQPLQNADSAIIADNTIPKDKAPARKKEINNPVVLIKRNNDLKKQPVERIKEEKPFVAENNQTRPTNNLPQPTSENHYVRQRIDTSKVIAAVPKKEPAIKPLLTRDKVTEQSPQPYYAVESSGNKG